MTTALFENGGEGKGGTKGKAFFSRLKIEEVEKEAKIPLDRQSVKNMINPAYAKGKLYLTFLSGIFSFCEICEVIFGKDLAPSKSMERAMKWKGFSCSALIGVLLPFPSIL